MICCSPKTGLFRVYGSVTHSASIPDPCLFLRGLPGMSDHVVTAAWSTSQGRTETQSPRGAVAKAAPLHGRPCTCPPCCSVSGGPARASETTTESTRGLLQTPRRACSSSDSTEAVAVHSAGKTGWTVELYEGSELTAPLSKAFGMWGRQGPTWAQERPFGEYRETLTGGAETLLS